MNLVEAPLRAAVPWLYSMDAATLATLLLLTVVVIGWADASFTLRLDSLPASHGGYEHADRRRNWGGLVYSLAASHAGRFVRHGV